MRIEGCKKAFPPEAIAFCRLQAETDCAGKRFSVCDCLFQSGDSAFGVRFGRQQLDELASDDAASRVLCRRFESRPVADSKTDQPWVPEVHGVNLPEIGLLLLVEALLRAGRCRARYHVDEPVGVRVNLPDTFVGGFGRNQHNHLDAIAVGERLVILQIVREREVRDNDAVHTDRHARTAKAFESVLHDGIQIAHQKDRHGDALVPDIFQLLEQEAKADSVAQRHRRRLLNHRSVRHRVGKRDANLDHVDSFALQRLQDAYRIVQVRKPRGIIDGKNVLLFVLK